jgi:hypothetical protein
MELLGAFDGCETENRRQVLRLRRKRLWRLSSDKQLP